jgi:hypothetical protein
LFFVSQEHGKNEKTKKEKTRKNEKNKNAANPGNPQNELRGIAATASKRHNFSILKLRCRTT